MDPGVGLRMLMIVTGIFLLCLTSFSLAKRKMTESFVLTWGLISVILVFAGILLNPAGWSHYISAAGMMLMALVGLCVLFGAYFISVRVSELMRKNVELAMHMTLMHHEVEELWHEVKRLRAEKQISEDGERNRYRANECQNRPEADGHWPEAKENDREAVL